MEGCQRNGSRTGNPCVSRAVGPGSRYFGHGSGERCRLGAHECCGRFGYY